MKQAHYVAFTKRYRQLMPGYNYADPCSLNSDSEVQDAIRQSVFNYFEGQLGWEREKCEARVEKEINRDIPKSLFENQEERWEWDLSESRVLDVGAGQGGGVLEALLRGADAYGVEPGQEFAELSRLRLRKEGFDSERIRKTGGESLSFPESSFDYVISLQVLEHVENPRPILSEIYRVLKPGGEAHIRCENYLAFREQHYRVPWLPLLPKQIGSLYLSAIGKNPSFLKKYVFYSTYPQIIKIVNEIGFENLTIKSKKKKLWNEREIERKSAKSAVYIVNKLPQKAAKKVIEGMLHLSNVFTTGIRLNLRKPR